MAQLSVKIKIGDREYPMKIDADEEVRVRKAGKLINEKMKQYSTNFGIHDKQDLVAMVAFEAMVEQLNLQEQGEASNEGVSEVLVEFDELISSALKK